MTWTLFASTLHQRRKPLLWYAVGLAAYSVVMVWFYPIMQSTGYQDLVREMPKEMVEFLAGSGADLTTFGGYMATEYLGFMWVLIIASAAILFATKSVSGEIASGTMELVLAQPVPRRTLVLVRLGALVVYLTILMAATVVPLYIGGVLQDVTMDVGNLAVLSGAGLLLSIAIGTVSMAVSAASNDSGKPAAIVGGALAAMWLLGFLAGSVEWAEKLNPVNLFHYWQPATIINKGTADAGMWWFYGGLALVGAVAAVAVFSRRDVS
jgi:ABC-2 type transport system permease protein